MPFTSVYWQQRFLNECNIVPCTLKNDAKGSENVLQFHPVFYFQRTAKLAGFTYCRHCFQVKGDLVWSLKPLSPPSPRFSFLFSFYPASVECDSQGVKMEFKTSTYHQSQETREDAFVSHSPHKAELTLGVHKDLFTFGEQVQRF